MAIWKRSNDGLTSLVGLSDELKIVDPSSTGYGSPCSALEVSLPHPHYLQDKRVRICQENRPGERQRELVMSRNVMRVFEDHLHTSHP